MTANYPLFEHWYKATDWILDKCDRMPKHTRFTISGRMAVITVEIMEGIIEAIYTKDRQEILKKINLNLEKLRIFFRICKDRNYITINQYSFAFDLVNEAGKMCGGWLKGGSTGFSP